MKLGSIAFQEIGLMYGVKEDLSKLEDTLSTIRAVLLDAGKQQQNHTTSTLVRRLREVVKDADLLLDEFAAEDQRRKTHTNGRLFGQVSDFFSSHNHLAFRVKMGHKMKDIRERLDDIAKDVSMCKFVNPRVVKAEEMKKPETHSFVVASEIVGREKDKETIIELLMQEHISMVAILGIGGLGKTTLAQLVYNDNEKVGKHFDTKIWVCVSNGFEVKTVVKTIVKATTYKDVNNLELDQLQKLLHGSLEGKRYLIVLDDVWNEDIIKWDQLRLLLNINGAHGSKILVTTRSARSALIMGIECPYNLEPLGEESSWDLFRRLAFKRGEEKVRPNLLTIGKEIVKLCNGVPEDIKHVGQMLYSKTEESQWLRVRNSKNFLSVDA